MGIKHISNKMHSVLLKEIFNSVSIKVLAMRKIIASSRVINLIEPYVRSYNIEAANSI